jgi:hypothetical protein
VGLLHLEREARSLHVGPQLGAAVVTVEALVWASDLVEGSILVHDVDDGQILVVGVGVGVGVGVCGQ